MNTYKQNEGRLIYFYNKIFNKYLLFNIIYNDVTLRIKL